MEFCALGINHHRSPILFREKFVLQKSQLSDELIILKNEGVEELAILSTCNRTEIYCYTNNINPVKNWFVKTGKLPTNILRPQMFQLHEKAAIKHIFRVTAGLDSMIIGEPNIVGQVKNSFKVAHENKTAGIHLHRLFQNAFSVAKIVRNKTDISKHGVSMASIAVQLCENLFGNISDLKILFIGSGEMIRLAATYFCARRPADLLFLSHDLHRAETMVRKYGGGANLISALEQVVADYDMVISCTESSLPIIGSGLVQRALKRRMHKPMMIVDWGVPRNVEPEATQHDDLYLYSIDDLQTIIDENQNLRSNESKKAEWIIDQHVEKFFRYLEHRQAVELIHKLRQSMIEKSQHEMSNALSRIEKGEDVKGVLEIFSHRLGNYWLHPWISKLREVEGKKFDEVFMLYKDIAQKYYNPRNKPKKNN